MVPPIYRKFLIPAKRNQTSSSSSSGAANGNGTTQNNSNDNTQTHNIDEIRRNIARYNELQSILNEDLFGPLQNDSVIIVVQVSKQADRSLCPMLGVGIGVCSLTL